MHRPFDRNICRSYEYGPCVGVSRLERWERAQALGLNPPPEVRQPFLSHDRHLNLHPLLQVKEILSTKEGSIDTQYTQSVFYGEV